MKIINEYGKFIFFWKVEEEYGFLSNWYLCDFTIDGITYNCTEQHMMYQKALLFNDLEAAKMILKSVSPQFQKAMGQKSKKF